VNANDKTNVCEHSSQLFKQFYDNEIKPHNTNSTTNASTTQREHDDQHFNLLVLLDLDLGSLSLARSRDADSTPREFGCSSARSGPAATAQPAFERYKYFSNFFALFSFFFFCFVLFSTVLNFSMPSKLAPDEALARRRREEEDSDLTQKQDQQIKETNNKSPRWGERVVGRLAQR
jgi:hypothetical protein